jgi:uncharacterized membrane protein YvbJ
VRCPKCDTVIPHHAKFCPKCGEKSPDSGSFDLPRAADALPSKGPLPRQGKVFLALVALALVALGIGIAGKMALMIYVGAGLVVLLVLVLLLGDLIGL